jgi:hypothetical protein
MPLAQPAHACAEQQEHPQAHRDRDERAPRLVHHHLVDDDLGADRHGEADQLDEERRKQHVAPDALVPQKFRPEPAEAELRRRRRTVFSRRVFRRLVSNEEHFGAKALVERRNRRRVRRLAAGDEVQQSLGVALDQERGLGDVPGEEPETGKRASRQLPFARAEPERAQRLDQLPNGMRRGKLLQEERGVKRNPVDLAHAADRPREICFGDIRRQLDRHALPLLPSA